MMLKEWIVSHKATKNLEFIPPKKTEYFAKNGLPLQKQYTFEETSVGAS